jgi:hypothetical protein
MSNLLNAPWCIANWDSCCVLAKLPNGDYVTIARFDNSGDASLAVALVNAHRGLEHPNKANNEKNKL